MARRVAATRLYVPRPRHDIVVRERLLKVLDTARRARLVLVSAPPGFGKSTLLAGWAAALSDGGSHVAWLALDAGDRDEAAFWRGITAAFGTVVPEVATATEELLDAGTPDDVLVSALVDVLAVADSDADPAIGADLHDAADIWLMLDDLHLVTGSGSPATECLRLLLGHLPPNAHVVASTRVDPDLPLSRWRVSGDLVEVRAADLRMTSDEAADYLNQASGLDLSDAEVAQLEDRTEGWVAALQLAALSLRGSDDPGAFIASFAGTNRYVIDYLVDEVLAQLKPDVREFLLRCSVLDRLTGPLCDAVTGRDDSRSVLDSLERSNLFVVPLDDRREWYRFHHLFAEVLAAHLLDEHPDLTPQLRLAASEWFEQAGLVEEAVSHSIASGDATRTTRLVEHAIPGIRRDRNDALLVGWLRVLPEDATRHSPLVSAFRGWMHLEAGELDEAALWLDRAEGAVTDPPAQSGDADADRELRSLPSTIETFRAGLAQASGAPGAAARHARAALDLAPEDDYLARGGAAGFLGLSAWVAGDVPTAVETFGQAVESLRLAGTAADESTGTVLLSDMWLAAGRHSRARSLLEQAIARRGGSAGPQRGVADLHVALAEVELELGHADPAAAMLDVAAELDRRLPMDANRWRLLAVQARVAALGGDGERAMALLDRAAEVHRDGFVPPTRPLPALRARVALQLGRIDEAEAWCASTGVERTDEVAHLREYELLTLDRLLIVRARRSVDGSADDAVELAGRVTDAAVRGGRVRSVVEALILGALAHHAADRRAEAVESMQAAWSAALEPVGHTRLVLDEGEPMLDLLRSCGGGAAGWLPAGSEAAPVPVVRTSDTSGSTRSRSTRAEPLADPLSEREEEVLRLLASDLTGPEIAAQLFVSVNTFRTHTKRIFTKLGASNRRAAVSRARELGLLP